jgi:hypothetical protein
MAALGKKGRDSEALREGACLMQNQRKRASRRGAALLECKDSKYLSCAKPYASVKNFLLVKDSKEHGIPAFNDLE